jgi:hypothetical protein
MHLMPWIIHRLDRCWSVLTKALFTDGAGGRSLVANNCRSCVELVIVPSASRISEPRARRQE